MTKCIEGILLNMKKIAPSILSADFSNLAQEVSFVEKGGAHLIHVDVMDGHFVPNISFGSTVMKSLVGKTNLQFDVHLMIENPEKYAKEFVTEQTEYITVHFEACSNLDVVLECIRKLGVKVGLAINPNTDVDNITEYLNKIDLVLVMTVYPGFGGQKIIIDALEKIALLKEIKLQQGLNFEVEVDGGITLENINTVTEKGADIVVAGSAIFGKEDIVRTTEEFVTRHGDVV